MAEEDFEIDIYGDEAGENDATAQGTGHQTYDSSTVTVANGSNSVHTPGTMKAEYDDLGQDNLDEGQEDGDPQAQPQQGVKRKEGSDNRPIDPGATNCLMISDLNWWVTDDEIRGWVRDANSEEELKDITFSEHKVNGKSKGQAYLEFASQQAATATKHQIEQPEAGQTASKKHNVVYSSPNNNPFRTLPKDAPARGNKDQGGRGGNVGGYNDRGMNNNGGNFGGGYRGRGGFNNNNRGNFNRNFSGGNMGAGGGGGFNNMGGGFNNNNNMAGSFGFNRGGMMGGGMRGAIGGGMRGGRGGMNMNNGMMGMAGMGGMGGMPMGGMPGMGGMGMMGGGMQGFQGMQPQFNPAFFGGQNQSGGGNEWQQNPHGAKRPRGE